MRLDGSDLQQIPTSAPWAMMPRWSLDGSRIAFQGHKQGDFELFVVGVDGVDRRTLSEFQGFDGHPSWTVVGLWGIS